MLTEQPSGNGGTAGGTRRAAVQQALHTSAKFPDAHQASPAGPGAGKGAPGGAIVPPPQARPLVAPLP